MIYNPQSGLVGWLKPLNRRHPRRSLALPPTALYAVRGVDLWHWGDFSPSSSSRRSRQVDLAQIDAALLDGAGFPQLMRYVLLPPSGRPSP